MVRAAPGRALCEACDLLERQGWGCFCDCTHLLTFRQKLAKLVHSLHRRIYGIVR